jgi:activator of 2-hydroxyglutaryl-CoA dehydratase
VRRPPCARSFESSRRLNETKQPEKTLEFLVRLEADLGIRRETCRVFITGSGGSALATLVGAKFVQEVTAVSLAVEKLHPEVHSVIELGGQDAKIIVFKEDSETGRKKKIPSMNDKCAGGSNLELGVDLVDHGTSALGPESLQMGLSISHCVNRRGSRGRVIQ